jgi:hypothetical protein
VIPAAALLGALALAASAPCLAEDAAGRPFATCFDPGNALALAAGPAPDGGAAAGLAWRWRSDTARAGGAPDWLRDQAVLEGEARWRGGGLSRGEAVAWQGVFVRRLAAPFVLLPGPRPVRLPFPVDVGLAVSAGGLRWERGGALEVEAVRTTLLLDVARHLGPLRRAAFGPEVAYELALARGAAPEHRVVPFSAAALDLQAESADGLWRAGLTARAGGQLRGGAGGLSGFAAGRLDLARVVAAVNDRPLALALRAEARHGAGAARLEAGVALRLELPR